MSEPTDADLLLRHTHDGSPTAFAELVARHLNLVYSVARRHLPSSATAEDVAQTVFVELARHGRDITPGTPLVAWLHVVARRTALNARRDEARRHAREQIAAELATMHSPSPDWKSIEPLLDEAVASLDATDHHAILLRFFENKSFREVGAAIGLSDDAAQKRVSRALDQLRTLLLRRGLTVTAATLATDLSAHAIVTAPVALGGAIATTATSLGTVALHTVATAAAKTVAMTTLQKSAFATVFAVLVGAGLYEAGIIYLQRSELKDLHQRTAIMLANLRATHDANLAANRLLKSVEERIDASLRPSVFSSAGSDPALEAQMKTWLTRLERLKRLATERPDLAIPQLKLLSSDDWFAVVTQPAPADAPPLDTEKGVRRALAALRLRAENLMATQLRNALGAYVNTHNGVLPSELTDLSPHFDQPVTPEMLSRYELIYTGKLSEVHTKDRSLGLIATRQVIDLDLDFLWGIGLGGFAPINALNLSLGEARVRYMQANHGQPATTEAQLTTYLRPPTNPFLAKKSLTSPRPPPRPSSK